MRGSVPLVGVERARLRTTLWVAGSCILAVLAGFGLAYQPWLVLGAGTGAVILAFTLLRPLAVIGIMLALGAFDLSFVTGGFKSLLPGMGGLDMNGIRLVGIVISVCAIAVVDPQVLKHAVGKRGRLYLLFLVYAAATLLYSPSQLDGLRLLFKLAYPFLFFIVVLGVVQTREDLGKLSDWILGGAFTIAMINPLFVIGGNYLVVDSGHLRLQGVGVHQNPFSIYLMMMLILAYTRFTVRGQFRYLGLCIIFSTWIVLTLTRITFAASLAALAGVGLYALLVDRNYRAVVGALVVGAALGIPLLPAVLDRSLGFVPTAGEFFTMLRDPVELVQSIDLQGRQYLWPVVLTLFAGNPIFGAGLGASTKTLQEMLPGWTDVVHNEYIRLASETGLIGVVLFFIAVLAWWLGVIRAGREPDPFIREFALPAAGGIVAWSIISITDNAFDYYAPFTQYIGFFCAATFASATLRRRTTAVEEEMDGDR